MALKRGSIHELWRSQKPFCNHFLFTDCLCCTLVWRMRWKIVFMSLIFHLLLILNIRSFCRIRRCFPLFLAAHRLCKCRMLGLVFCRFWLWHGPTSLSCMLHRSGGSIRVLIRCFSVYLRLFCKLCHLIGAILMHRSYHKIHQYL